MGAGSRGVTGRRAYNDNAAFETGQAGAGSRVGVGGRPSRRVLPAAPYPTLFNGSVGCLVPPLGEGAAPPIWRRTAREHVRNDSFITPRHTHAPVVQLHVELCTLRARPVRGRVDTHHSLSTHTRTRNTHRARGTYSTVNLSYSSPQAAPCRTVATKSTPNMSFHGWWASLAMARETCAHGDQLPPLSR